MAAPLPDSIQPFLEYLQFEKRYSALTIRAYRHDLAEFFTFLVSNYGPTMPGQVTHPMVRSWLAALKEEGLGSRSLNRKISTLKSFFKFCLKQGIVEISPMVKVISPKSGSRLPAFLKEGETLQLVESLKSSADDWKSLNARLLITIFYSTGMRLSELLNLKEKQVDWSQGQVKVLGKGNKERLIPVSPALLDLIREYSRRKKQEFEKTDDVLLVTEKGKKLYPKYAWLLVNAYLGTVSTLDKKSPHVLRHSFATHLMNNGAGLEAVRELLGHSSLAATQVYTHNTIEKLKDIHKKAHPKA